MVIKGNDWGRKDLYICRVYFILYRVFCFFLTFCLSVLREGFIDSGVHFTLFFCGSLHGMARGSSKYLLGFG